MSGPVDFTDEDFKSFEDEVRFDEKLSGETFRNTVMNGLNYIDDLGIYDMSRSIVKQIISSITHRNPKKVRFDHSAPPIRTYICNGCHQEFRFKRKQAHANKHDPPVRKAITRQNRLYCSIACVPPRTTRPCPIETRLDDCDPEPGSADSLDVCVGSLESLNLNQNIPQITERINEKTLTTYIHFNKTFQFRLQRR